jgi:hypothetical protein
LIAIVRVVGRLIHHREHFAGIDVEHDGGTRFRTMFLHGCFQLAIGKILNA